MANEGLDETSPAEHQVLYLNLIEKLAEVDWTQPRAAVVQAAGEACVAAVLVLDTGLRAVEVGTVLSLRAAIVPLDALNPEQARARFGELIHPRRGPTASSRSPAEGSGGRSSSRAS